VYYSHFGLAQPPFRITPDTDIFFGGANRGPILEAVMYAIRQGEGMIKVTGEVGSGKTMLCNMLQARLPEHVETVYLANPSVSPEEIVRAIAFELQLKLPPESGRLETTQALHDYLLERHSQGKQVVLFVEESQSMPLATLEEIRLLTNLETARSKLLQIVLFGQPELDANLRQPQIRQLRDRITQSFHLAPLKGDEVGAYLAFRLRAAGYHGPDLFSAVVVRAIAKASDGLTRRINVITDKALLAAFAENTHTVNLKHVRAAVRDSEFDAPASARPPLRLASALSLLAIGAGTGVAIYAGVQAYQERLVSSVGVAAVESSTAKAAAKSPAFDAGPDKAVPAKSTESAGEASVADKTQPPTAPGSSSPASAEPVTQRETPSATPVASVATPLGQAPAQPSAVAAGDRLAEESPNEQASANSPTLKQTGDILKARLEATDIWLGGASKNIHTIQLLGADNEKQLKQHLNVLTKSLDINGVFVYRTIAKGKPSVTVLYGSFANRRAALEAMAKLPAPLRAYRPYLRTVQGIRAELAQRKSDATAHGN
jgi:MSHA biogenesis protein MshM